MKKMGWIVLMMALCLCLLAGCNGESQASSETSSETEEYAAQPTGLPGKPVKIVVASDLHYFSPELTDGGELFQSLCEIGFKDGKVVPYSSQLTDAFLEAVKKEKPDALILSGDLTFNGEKKNHEELAQKLKTLSQKGIPVLVIPGNHDIDSVGASSYMGSQVVPVENVTGEQFRQIYEGLTVKEPLSWAEDSNSFVYPLTGDIWVMMIDANVTETKGSVSPSTMKWVEEQLAAAQKKQIHVITVTHQNLLKHNPLFGTGYFLNNSRELAEVYGRYGVKLNLSGHLHIQHIQQAAVGTYDIASSSLAVAPNQYGVLNIDRDRLVLYETIPVDVELWASEHNLDDPNLLDFTNYSQTFFETGTRAQAWPELGIAGVPLDQRQTMCDFALKLNNEYFAGTVYQHLDRFKDDPAWEMWQELKDKSFFADYIISIMERANKYETVMKLSLVGDRAYED